MYRHNQVTTVTAAICDVLHMCKLTSQGSITDFVKPSGNSHLLRFTNSMSSKQGRKFNLQNNSGRMTELNNLIFV